MTYLKRNHMLYILLIPGLTYVFIFELLPLYGLVIAFKDFDMFAVPGNPFLSILQSPWAGFEHFARIFGRKDFINALYNTFIISCYKIIFTFPLPILFALMLNESRNSGFRKGVQLSVYLPHFLSWVVVSGIFFSLLGGTGVINNALAFFGREKINFLMDSSKFRAVLVVSDAWKELGWNSIIYFAAIAGLDQECYEAAEVDGANRFQQMLYITMPGLIPTIVLMFILRVGSIMDAGFNQIFVMYNPAVYDVSDIIGTYVFRMCLGRLEFSMGTAVGLFNSVVALTLVLLSNYFAKKSTGKGIW